MFTPCWRVHRHPSPRHPRPDRQRGSSRGTPVNRANEGSSDKSIRKITEIAWLATRGIFVL
jgi:hypothetical protein